MSLTDAKVWETELYANIFSHLLDIFFLVFLCDFYITSSWFEFMLLMFTKTVTLHTEGMV